MASWRRIMGRQRLVGAALLLSACLQATPFETDPSFVDLTSSELRKLRAQPAPTGAFTFAAFGDTHDEYDDLERTVRIINGTPGIEFNIIAGDMTDRGLLQEFEWSGELYYELNAPFLTVIGNHDHLSAGREIYEEMYGPLQYSFEYGGLKFVMFDSNTLENHAAPNRSWLLDQVRDRGKARGVVLVTHHDYTAPDDLEGGTNRAFYDELLQEPGIVLAIHGHLNDYRLRMVHGVPVLQCATYQNLRYHTLVTVDEEQITFQRCLFDSCEPVEPVAEEEVTP